MLGNGEILSSLQDRKHSDLVFEINFCPASSSRKPHFDIKNILFSHHDPASLFPYPDKTQSPNDLQKIFQIHTIPILFWVSQLIQNVVEIDLKISSILLPSLRISRDFIFDGDEHAEKVAILVLKNLLIYCFRCLNAFIEHFGFVDG